MIGILNSYFVPVYISYDAHDKGDAPEADKKEWRRIYHEATTKLRRSGTVHVYILAPASAEVIESIDIGTAVQPEKLLARLQGVVQKLKTPEGNPVIQPAPQSCPPPCAPDSLVLHLVARSYKGTWNEFPVENWIVLSRSEAMKLFPEKAAMAGASWELDREVTARFLSKFLPNGYGYASYHKIQILEQSLKATIDSAEKGSVKARLEGKLKLRHHSLNFSVQPPAPSAEIAEMSLTGFIDLDRDRQEVLAFRLLADKATARDGNVEYAVGVRSVP